MIHGENIKICEAVSMLRSGFQRRTLPTNTPELSLRSQIFEFAVKLRLDGIPVHVPTEELNGFLTLVTHPVELRVNMSGSPHDGAVSD